MTSLNDAVPYNAASVDASTFTLSKTSLKPQKLEPLGVEALAHDPTGDAWGSDYNGGMWRISASDGAMEKMFDIPQGRTLGMAIEEVGDKKLEALLCTQHGGLVRIKDLRSSVPDFIQLVPPEKVGFPNSAVATCSGYFVSDSTQNKDLMASIVNGETDGRLLFLSKQTGDLSTVLEGLAFPNGLLVADYAKDEVWLAETLRGQVTLFNRLGQGLKTVGLPLRPDNLSPCEGGFTAAGPMRTDWVEERPWLRVLLFRAISSGWSSAPRQGVVWVKDGQVTDAKFVKGVGGLSQVLVQGDRMYYCSYLAEQPLAMSFIERGIKQSSETAKEGESNKEENEEGKQVDKEVKSNEAKKVNRNEVGNNKPRDEGEVNNAEDAKEGRANIGSSKAKDEGEAKLGKSNKANEEDKQDDSNKAEDCKSHQAKEEATGESYQAKEEAKGESHQAKEEATGESYQAKEEAKGESYEAKEEATGESNQAKDEAKGESNQAREKAKGESNQAKEDAKQVDKAKANASASNQAKEEAKGESNPAEEDAKQVDKARANASASNQAKEDAKQVDKAKSNASASNPAMEQAKEEAKGESNPAEEDAKQVDKAKANASANNQAKGESNQAKADSKQVDKAKDNASASNQAKEDVKQTQGQ